MNKKGYDFHDPFLDNKSNFIPENISKMDKSEIKELVEELKLYQDQLSNISNGKPKRKDMDLFKSYYEKNYKKMVEYIQFSKNKALSEKAKELPVLKQLFSNFNIYMSLLIVLMIGPLALIVYLYTLTGYDQLIYIMLAVDAVIIFFLVRKIQKESAYVINTLSGAIPVMKNVVKIIEDNYKE